MTHHPSPASGSTPLWRPIVVGAAIAALAAASGVGSAMASTPHDAADAPALQGLEAQYYTITNTDTFALEQQNLQTTIVDPNVDVDDMVPVYKALTGQSENAGVRWSGEVTAPKTGDYTFSAIGDNGFRLWVGGSDSSDELIDWWQNQWDQEQTADHTVHLTAGQPVPITFEQFQATGGAYVHLSWASADAGVSKQVVPTSALTTPADFHPYAATATIPSNGKTVDVTLPGAVSQASGATDHVRVSVGGVDYPVAGVAAGATPTHLVVTLGDPVPRDVTAIVAYDGKGGLAADGGAVPSFATRVTNDSTFRITTKWTKDVDPNHPLPEYPRPQLTRTDWQNLNGKWDFKPLAAEDSTPPSSWAGAKTAVVPYPTESKLSGIEDHYDHFAYHRTFTVPADWNVGTKKNQQKLVLNFGAVDYQTSVYVNGHDVVDHTGGYDAFSADITSALKKGTNDLVVRVTDTTGNQPIGKQNPHPTGLSYTASSGIWQTVWMEPVQQVHVDSLKLTPQLSASGDSVDVTAVAPGASKNAVVFATAYDAKGHKAGTVSGSANQKLSVPIASSHRWTPDDPYLYTVKVQLRDGASKDTVGSYVGVRSIGIKSIDGVNRIVLNGKQTFLLATLDQGFWPDGIYTAPTDEALNWDIQATKDLGFNTIRKHIKVEPQRWYYDAAKDGMMVWQDMPSSSNSDAAQQTEWKSELHAMIDQHDSDTAIIGWIPFNEGWGEWSQDGAADVAKSIKAQDPTRLVDTRSGQNCCDMPGDNGSGDIIDWHTYSGPATPTPDATRAAIDGEHGGLSMTVLGHIWSNAASPYQAFDSSKSLTDAYVQNTASLVGLARSQLSGSVYTQLTDIEGETNGFYTYDRKVAKMQNSRVRAINQEVVAAGSGEPAAKGSKKAVGSWAFDQSSGVTSPDSTGKAGDATLTGGAVLAPGHVGQALSLNGKTAQATASVPKLDTAQSYTVSAWANLAELPTGYATAVAAHGLGTGVSPFFLQYSGSGNASQGFAFSFPNGPRAIASDVPVKTGTWYHVVGVRDADAGTIAVYVDGHLAATEHTTEANATSGTLTIGSGQWNGGDGDFLHGAVDGVQVFDRALTADEVGALS